VYCLRVGSAPAAGASGLVLVAEGGAEATTTAPLIAPDAMSVLRVVGTPNRLRLAGQFTALLLFAGDDGGG
jgi:hypothetical protein